MVKQLNLLSANGDDQPTPAGAKVVPIALHTEMERSYLEYAMSVIVGRALPDVRDGLKPVHRRILYAMHELGLTPDRPYRKCARVVGDVLGKYHPHGDQAVYDALVRMAQDFSSRYPLLDGHGNFGSVDNDPPAAMRYTETRLAPVANLALLGEIGDETVDFTGNFDNSQDEPIVLPAQLPILLLNGCSGIAVGMATNVPPHNLGELVDALIALIDQPQLADSQLLELVPGPDFPTGGLIIGTEGIREAYASGRGSITLRGVVQVEEIQPGRGRHRRPALIITELPYQVNKAGLLEKIAELINQGRIDGIADLRDESDRDGMRIVIELKREAQPQVVLEQLYRQTPLQINFGVIMLALCDGQPRQMGLRELLQRFLNFREETLIRRYQHQLERAQTQQHQITGLITALENLDVVITILRQSPDGATAKQAFQTQLQLSERQSEAILAMPLRRLTGLEQEKLRTEARELAEKIQGLELLLSSRHERLKSLKKDLRGLKRQFGDVRRTQIQTEPAAPMSLDSLNVDSDVILELSQRGYLRCQPGERSRRGNGANGHAASLNGHASGQPEFQELKKDLPVFSQSARLSDSLLVFTQSGKVYSLALRDVPTGDRRGTPLVTLLPDSAQGEIVVGQLLVSATPTAAELVVLTRQGRIKRIDMGELAELTGRGLSICKLKDEDQIFWVSPLATDAEVVLATSASRVLRFLPAEIPLMGRVAMGQAALKLGKQETLVGAVQLQSFDNLVLISQQGYGKQMPINAVRLTHLGDLGTPALQFAQRSDRLAAIITAPDERELVLLTDANRFLQLPLASIPLWGKDGAGKRLVTPRDGEKIISAIAQ